MLPKNAGSFRMVVDYGKVNSKIFFDSYPMPKIEQALEQLGAAAIFSVLDLNSASYQIHFQLRVSVLLLSAPHLDSLN